MTHWCLYAPVGTLNYHYIAEIYKYWPHASIRRSDSIQFNSSQIGPTLPCDRRPVRPAELQPLLKESPDLDNSSSCADTPLCGLLTIHSNQAFYRRKAGAYGC